MIRVADHLLSIMVLFAITLHLTWAATLLIDSSATSATAVNALFRFITLPLLLVAIIATAALLALIAMVTRSQWTLLLLLPQQVLLMMSAAGAIEAVWTAQFADGVIRPRAFIAADQLYSVLAAVWHTVAIVAYTLRTAR